MKKVPIIAIIVISIFIFLFIQMNVARAATVWISGNLKNKTNSPVAASITLYQPNTSNVNVIGQTDATGKYNFSSSSGVYDVQYAISNFFVQNFWVKLSSLNIISNVKDPVNYVTGYSAENKLSLTVNTTAKQTVQTYSPQKPKRVLINGTNATEVFSLSSLSDNTWFYSSAEKKLYVRVVPTLPNPATNLADIPDDFPLDYGWLSPPPIAFVDYSVTRTAGQPSLRLEKHVNGVDPNVNREIDGKWYSVKPGDHIVAKVWIKVQGGATDGYEWEGARIGIDLYGGQNYLLWGIVEPTYRNPHIANEEKAQYVHWGTQGWVQRTIEFDIPADYFTYNHLTRQTVPPTQASSFVLWFQVWSSRYYGSQDGLAWFADAELYINP